MENFKKIIAYSKLKELNDLIDDDRIKSLLKEYFIEYDYEKIPKYHFKCNKCNIIYNRKQQFSINYGDVKRYQNKCIDCHDLVTAESKLKSDLRRVATPLQNRLKFINVIWYYNYSTHNRPSLINHIDEICSMCSKHKLSINNNCQSCPYAKRIDYLCKIINNDIKNRNDTIDKIITKEHIEVRKLTTQLNRKLLKIKKKLHTN